MRRISRRWCPASSPGAPNSEVVSATVPGRSSPLCPGASPAELERPDVVARHGNPSGPARPADAVRRQRLQDPGIACAGPQRRTACRSRRGPPPRCRPSSSSSAPQRTCASRETSTLCGSRSDCPHTSGHRPHIPLICFLMSVATGRTNTRASLTSRPIMSEAPAPTARPAGDPAPCPATAATSIAAAP